ncbi:MAG: hypothetical protein ABIY48_01050 [Acidimicrobiales bacterium]
MRHRRRIALRLLGTSSLLVATALTVLPAGSGAAEPSVVGWWYRDVPLSEASSVQSQSAGAPVVAQVATSPDSPRQVPPPPVLPPAPIPTTPPAVTVPDPGGNAPTPSQAPTGGLLVAADVTGIRAMSALRFVVSDAGGAILRLTIAQGSTPSPGVRACPALSDWQPGPDQPWSTRPAYGCDRVAVSSTLSSDGTTMQWILPDTFKSPDSLFYDVLLVPIGGNGTPFQVAFNKPASDAFTVTSPAPEPEVPTTEALPEDLPPPIDSFSSDGYDLGAVGGSFPGVPVETVQVQPTGDHRAVAQGPLNRLADALENPTTRRIATLALILLGAYAYWQSGQTVQRAPRLLGALAGGGDGTAASLPPVVAHPRGIGRFARDRHAPPPML